MIGSHNQQNAHLWIFSRYKATSAPKGYVAATSETGKVTYVSDHNQHLDQCFWLPTLTPSSDSSQTRTVAEEPMCPGGTACSKPHVLRGLKQLKPVIFTQTTSVPKSQPPANQSVQAAEPKPSNSEFQYQCPTCSRHLTPTWPSVALSPCGHVICAQCAEKTVMDTSERACSVCDEPVSETFDLSSATSFAARGSAVVTSRLCPAFVG